MNRDEHKRVSKTTSKSIINKFQCPFLLHRDNTTTLTRHAEFSRRLKNLNNSTLVRAVDIYQRYRNISIIKILCLQSHIHSHTIDTFHILLTSMCGDILVITTVLRSKSISPVPPGVMQLVLPALVKLVVV